MKNTVKKPTKNKKKKKMMIFVFNKNILNFSQKWKTKENRKKRIEKKKLREL